MSELDCFHSVPLTTYTGLWDSPGVSHHLVASPTGLVIHMPLLVSCSVSATLCKCNEMPIKKAQESCSVAGWFKLDTCMKWLKIVFLNLKITGGQYVRFTSAGANKKHRGTTQSFLFLQINWWWCWGQERGNTVHFWWCLSVRKESQLFSHLSSHYLLPDLQISNTFL